MLLYETSVQTIFNLICGNNHNTSVIQMSSVQSIEEPGICFKIMKSSFYSLHFNFRDFDNFSLINTNWVF